MQYTLKALCSDKIQGDRTRCAVSLHFVIVWKAAAGCSRDVIERGAAMLGWELNDLIDRTIRAMRTSSAVD